VAYVAGSELVVDGLLLWNGGIHLPQGVLDRLEEFVEGGGFADGDIKDLVEGGGILSGRGKEIGLDDVVDVTEVATGLAVAKNMDGLVLKEGSEPAWNDGGICACRILAWAEDIEIAQANGAQSKGAGEDASVGFVHRFCGGVWGKGLADVVFDFWQGWMVAIDRTARGVNKAPDFGVAGGDEHVEKARNVGVVGSNGIGKRAGN